MELFHVETGAISNQDCSEEKIPFLKRFPTDDGQAKKSKAFVVNDSLPCITNLSLSFGNQSYTDKKDNLVSPAYQSHNYHQLSPEGLKDPLHLKSRINTKILVNERYSEPSIEANVIFNPFVAKQEIESSAEAEIGRKITILEFVKSLAAQPTSSSSCQSVSLSSGKKTLGELAKEWNPNTALNGTSHNVFEEKTKTKEKLVEDEKTLVRHSAYYSTSSAIHGMTSEECRLRSKLKAKRYYNRDEEYKEKRSNTPPLIKLSSVVSK